MVWYDRGSSVAKGFGEGERETLVAGACHDDKFGSFDELFDFFFSYPSMPDKGFAIIGLGHEFFFHVAFAEDVARPAFWLGFEPGIDENVGPFFVDDAADEDDFVFAQFGGNAVVRGKVGFDVEFFVGQT